VFHSALTRMRSAVTLLALLAIFTGLLPAQRAAAQQTVVLTEWELREKVLDEWISKQDSLHDKTETHTLVSLGYELIKRDVALYPEVAVQQIELLRERYYQRLGPRGGDLEYRKSLPFNVTETALFAAALGMPNLADLAKRVYQERKAHAIQSVPLVVGEHSRAYYQSVVDSNGLEEASRLLLQEQSAEAFQRGQNSASFVQAWDAVLGPLTGVKLSDFLAKEFDIKAFLIGHPEAGVPQKVIDSIKPDGSLEISLADLQQLAKGEFATINASIDDMQKTLVTLSAQQKELINAIGDLQAQAQAEAKAKEHQLKIQAAGSALSIITTLISFEDPKLAGQINVVGQSLIKVGDSIGGWLQATAGLSGLAKLGSLSTVVMTGNILGAVMNIVSLFGPQQPTPEQMILEEIGKLRQQVDQLRTEMHTRFDQIDRELNTIYTTMHTRFDQIDLQLGRIKGSLEEIQESLLGLSISLNRLERNNAEYFDALGRRPLREAFNGAIGYQERTGLEMPYQPDFVNYENVFHTWATINAFDPISAGPTQRDYSDGQVFAELSAAPLDANLNYLNGWLQAHGMQPFATSRLPSPRDWAFASRAYAQLGQNWPAHLRRIDPQRRAALDTVGAELQQALANIARIETSTGPQGNGPLFSGATAYYNEKLQGVDSALRASEASFVQEVQSALSRPVPFELYGGLNQSLPLPYQPEGFASLRCGTEGLPEGGLAAPLHLKNILQGYNRFALAEYLGLKALQVCLFGEWLSVEPPCADPSSPFCIRAGIMRVFIIVRSDNVILARSNLPSFQRRYNPNMGEVLTSDWGSLKASFERMLVNESAPPLTGTAAEQLGKVNAALTSKLVELQGAYASRVLGELGRGSMQARLVELAGAKKLLESFITLGLPRATANDDLLRSLLFSKESLVDNQQIAGFYAPPAAGQAVSEADLMVSPRAKLLELAKRRREVLSNVLTDYLGGISTESYSEDNALLGGARFDIMMAEALADPSGPLPGGGWVVSLPLVRR
jgi:hypothetical protein